MSKENKNEQTQGYALEKENYILMAIGFAIIILGFILMAGGKIEDPNTFYPNNDPSQTPEMFSFRRITLAPILVLFGYAFEIFAIMVRPESKIIQKLFRK